MLGIHDLTLYVISAFLLSLTPGPDSLLVMSRSAMLGVRAGLRCWVFARGVWCMWWRLLWGYRRFSPVLPRHLCW
mgnify:CR=1 FL=1